MPFTFSHPAVVLPATYLPKKYYSLSALIVGSMTPDFEYFIRMKDYSKYSHTVTGVFWFDLPLGLMLLFIYHNVVRDTLISYLPFVLNVRLSPFQNFNWHKYFFKNILVVLISLLVGIATHLLWDSFTHSGDYFAEVIPVLEQKTWLMDRAVTNTNILQYACSVVGGIIMILYVLHFPEGRFTGKPNILNFWLMVMLIMIMVLNARLYLDSILHHQRHEDIIVTMISGSLIGICVMSVLLNNTQIATNKKFRKVINF